MEPFVMADNNLVFFAPTPGIILIRKAVLIPACQIITAGIPDSTGCLLIRVRFFSCPDSCKYHSFHRKVTLISISFLIQFSLTKRRSYLWLPRDLRLLKRLPLLLTCLRPESSDPSVTLLRSKLFLSSVKGHVQAGYMASFANRLTIHTFSVIALDTI